MPRKPFALLTDHELRLMEVVWRLGKATVAEITASVATPTLAYNTVLTTLRKLEAKGYLAHDVGRRAFVYRPIVARKQVAIFAVRWVLLRFFSDAPDLLASALQTDELTFSSGRFS